jgi:hypothetical protein
MREARLSRRVLILAEKPLKKPPRGSACVSRFGYYARRRVWGIGKVAARVIIRGTHLGELPSIAPTGNRAAVMGQEIWRVAGTRITEHWGRFEELDRSKNSASSRRETSAPARLKRRLPRREVWKTAEQEMPDSRVRKILITGQEKPAARILAFHRAPNGTLTAAGSFATGGLGTDGGLGNQGGLTLTGDNAAAHATTAEKREASEHPAFRNVSPFAEQGPNSLREPLVERHGSGTDQAAANGFSSALGPYTDRTGTSSRRKYRSNCPRWSYQ